MPKMKSIVFKGKRIYVRNVTSLRRHADKDPKRKTGLSKKGEWNSVVLGLGLKNVKGYHSDINRAKNSLEFELEGVKLAKGKHYKETRERKWLSFNLVDPKSFVKLKEEFDGDLVKAIRGWIDGKAKTKMPHWTEVADAFIVNGLQIGVRASNQGIRNAFIEHMSHVPNIELVFERLTGRRFDLIGHGGISNPLEGLIFYHGPKGQIILEYKGKRFDVTKNYNTIIENSLRARRRRKRIQKKK